jgi:hypothetical protein
MKLNFVYLAFLILAPANIIFSQSPDWIKYEKRVLKYPESIYLTGFSSETNYYGDDQNELIARCEENARKELTEAVKVSIKSITVSGINNVNTGINQETVEYIKQSSVSFSNLDIAGLTTQHYYDKKKKIAYAFCYVKRADLIAHYKQKVNSGLKDLELKKQFADDMLKADLQQKALQAYFECLPILRELEEAQAVLAAMGKRDEVSLKKEKTLQLKAEIDHGINQLNSIAKNSISDVAFFIAEGLNMQVKDLKGKVKLSSFTFEDTRMGSPLSKRLHKELEQKLVSETNLEIHNLQYASQYKKQSLLDYIITGTYWNDNEYLKIIVVLRDFKTGKAIASVETKLSKAFCEKNKLEYLPANFIEVNTKRKNFLENEVIGGDLSLEVWTNKGSDDLLFTEGDTLRLFLRVNKPAYIRFIYYLADGAKVLLLDNYYIGIDKVNKVYELPEKFVCAEPFGAEVLLVNAQTEKFEPLNTRKQYGYEFILDDIPEILANTRGFKKVENGELMRAERSIVITTMGKFDDELRAFDDF